MQAVEGWSTVTVEQCCGILDSKRVPINTVDREKRIGEIPYYGANGLQGYIDGFIFDEPLVLIAEDGGNFDEFASRSIAYRIYGKSWVNNHAHVLRAKREFCQDAIFYNLEHKDIQSFMVGGTRSKLNQSALRSITLMECDREANSLVSNLEKTKQLKTAFMQDLLTGKVRVTPLLKNQEASA